MNVRPPLQQKCDISADAVNPRRRFSIYHKMLQESVLLNILRIL